MAETRRILSCDGGGIRGIITLRCLEAFERYCGEPCRDYFHMFAGTSTGALIAGSLASGMQVSELIGLYTDRRSEIFSKRLLGFLHPLATKYDKKGLHAILLEYFGQTKLRDLSKDILITAVDTVRSETTYFSSFGLPGGVRYGTYGDVRLRDAVEASASAPTYFTAHGRFIDGGTTIYNNPAYVGAVEALRYSSDKKTNQPSSYDGATVEVYSFSTGLHAQALEPDEAMKKSGLGWLKYVISESGNQAGYQQSYVSQSELDIAEAAVSFYRYDLYITPASVREADPETTIDPDTLTLDAVDEERFALLDKLGANYGAYLLANNFFVRPTGRAAGLPSVNQNGIARGQGAAGFWLEHRKPQMPDDYLQQVLRQFDEIDLQLDS